MTVRERTIFGVSLLFMLAPSVHFALCSNNFFASGLDYESLEGIYAAELISGMGYYPPLFRIFLRLINFVVGPAMWAYALGSLAFPALGSVFVWKMIRQRWGSDAGLLAAFLFLNLPGFVIVTKYIYHDLTMLLFVPWSLYLLLGTEKFSQRRESVLLGAAIGLGMLSRWLYGLYVVVPLLWIAVMAIVDAAGEGTRQAVLARIKNMVLCAGVALAVCGWWYAIYMDWVRLAMTTENDPTFAVYSYRAMLGEYLRYLTETYLRTPMIPVVGLGLALFLFLRPGFAIVSAVSLAVLPVGILSLMVHCEERYIVPVLVFLACGTAAGIFSMKKSLFRNALVALTAGVTVLVSLDTTYHNALFPIRDVRLIERQHRNGRLAWNRARPDKALDFIENYVKNERPGKILLVGVHPACNNIHIEKGALQMAFLANRDRYANLEVVGYFLGLGYGRFVEELRGDMLDVILLETGWEASCAERTRARFKTASMSAPTVDIYSGEIVKYTIPENPGEVDFIMGEFDLAGRLDLPYSISVDVMVRRERQDGLRPTAQ